MAEGDEKEQDKDGEQEVHKEEPPVVKHSYTWQAVNHVAPTIGSGTIFAITYFKTVPGDIVIDLSHHHSPLYYHIQNAIAWSPVAFTGAIFAITAATNVILTIAPNSEVHHYYPHHQALQAFNSWVPTIIAGSTSAGVFVTSTVFGDKAKLANHIVTDGVEVLDEAARAEMIRERLKDHTYDLAADDGTMGYVDLFSNRGERIVTYIVEAIAQAIFAAMSWGILSRLPRLDDNNKLWYFATICRAADFTEYSITNTINAFARAVKIILDITLISWLTKTLGIAKPVKVIPPKNSQPDLSDKVEEELENLGTNVKENAKLVKNEVVAGAKEVEHEAEKVVEDTEAAARLAGAKIKEGAKEIEHEVEHIDDEAEAAAKLVKDKVEEGAEEVEHEVEHIDEEAEAAAKLVKDKVEEGAKEIEHEVEHIDDEAKAAAKLVKDKVEEEIKEIEQVVIHVEENLSDGTKNFNAEVKQGIEKVEEDLKELTHHHPTVNPNLVQNAGAIEQDRIDSNTVTPVQQHHHSGFVEGMRKVGHNIHEDEKEVVHEIVHGVNEFGHQAHEAEKKFVHGIGHLGSSVIHEITHPHCGGSANDVVTQTEARGSKDAKKADEKSTTQNSQSSAADSKSGGSSNTGGSNSDGKQHASFEGDKRYNDEDKSHQQDSSYLANFADKTPKEVSFNITIVSSKEAKVPVSPEREEYNKSVAAIAKEQAEGGLIRVKGEDWFDSSSYPELPSLEQKLFTQPFLIIADPSSGVVKMVGDVMPDLIPGIMKII